VDFMELGWMVIKPKPIWLVGPLTWWTII